MSTPNSNLRFAVIGDPVAHSLSPLIHTTSFEHLGIDATYEAIHVGSDELGDAIARFRNQGFTGINVTMPHKVAVIEFLDELSDSARLMGAVNTVHFVDGRAVGHNTDGRGLWSSVEALGVNLKNSRAVVIGAGGTGAAVVTQAARDGIAHVAYLNRPGPRLDQAHEHAQTLREATGVSIDVVALDDAGAQAAIEEADVVVDCTSVGMGELEGETNVPASSIRDTHVVVDTVYHPRETRLLREAKASGARIVTGLDMLVGQAAIAEEIWLGVTMPRDAVEYALTRDDLHE